MPRATVGSRFALTLAEMLVVLVILSVVAAIAVQSLAPVAEQARYDATKKTLADTRRAIVGEPGADIAITGFVADMGRLPITPIELVSGEGLPQFANAGIVDDEQLGTLRLPMGWRGPYIFTGGGPPRDGWGNLFEGTWNSGLIDVGCPNAQPPITSADYRSDLTLTLLPTHWQAGAVTGRLFAFNPEMPDVKNPIAVGDTWRVVLVGAAGGTLGTYEGTVTVSPGPTERQFVNFVFDDMGRLPIGPKLLRIVKNNRPFGGLINLTLRAGATHSIDVPVEYVTPSSGTGS